MVMGGRDVQTRTQTYV